MGTDTKKLRSRIRSVDSTLHLTRAMGLVASSKIRRAMASMSKSRAYVKSVQELIDLLANSPECANSPYLQEREGGRRRMIVIAGDRGLAGGYNSNIFKLAKEYADAAIIPIGKRACERFEGGYASAESFAAAEAANLAEELCREFAGGEWDRLGIICTGYVSMMAQEARVQWILPLQRSGRGRKRSVLFEPDEETMLEAAVREYVSGSIIAAVRESFACELAARRCAMDSAGRNAQLMIDELQLRYNRARQDAITQELTEIVAGGEE